MILLDKTKITVDGVDVYPDHAEKAQFYMVPGAVQLSRLDGRPALSYLWYIADKSDSDGTGFLNFQVDTSVSDAVQTDIRGKIEALYGIPQQTVELVYPTYTRGHVNFSALSGIAQKAADKDAKVPVGDGGVVYADKDQIVWNAGSSSLVGDNNAVCSVKFTNEGKLAGLMSEALMERQPTISATYALEFSALRPSVEFKVEGTLDKTINSLAFSIGAGIPLEAFMLNLGMTGQFVKVMNDMGLNITVTKYGGTDGKGLEWAQKIVMDYILKEFFTVGIKDSDPGNWTPLKEAPKVETALKRSRDIGDQAEEKSKEKGDKPEETKAKAQEAVKSSMPELPIPKLNISVAVARLQQTNKIDFTYTEMSAQSYPVAPQSLVLLPKDSDPKDFVRMINRADNPFGLPLPVTVAAPTKDIVTSYGLRTINLNVGYPATDATQRERLSLIDGEIKTGKNPLPFQYNKAGDANVAFSAEFIFDPSSDWAAKDTHYTFTGETGGAIDVMPGAYLGLVKQTVALASDFVWSGTSQAIVTISGPGVEPPVKVVLSKGDKEPVTTVKIRASNRNPALTYSVDLLDNGTKVHSYGPLDVIGGQITVRDQFAGHYTVEVINTLSGTSPVALSLMYESGKGYKWNSPVVVVKKDSSVTPFVVPTPDALVAADVKLTVVQQTAKGKKTSTITPEDAIFLSDDA